METAGKETPPKHSRRLSHRLSGIAGRNCAAPHPVPLWSADHHESVPRASSARIQFWQVSRPGCIGTPEARRWQPWPPRMGWGGISQSLARTSLELGQMKTYRFGVNVGPSRSRAEWAQKARKLEDLGYSTLTAPDHLSGFFAPMPALISAAEATKNLRVGTNVLNNDFRHPVLVAREAATVDLLTEGRFELGLGAGHMQSEYDQAGLSFDAGRIRVERLSEAVTLIKRLLSGEQVTLAGRYYSVTGHTIYPLPVQRPHPPILVGGNGLNL